MLPLIPPAAMAGDSLPAAPLAPAAAGAHAPTPFRQLLAQLQGAQPALAQLPLTGGLHAPGDAPAASARAPLFPEQSASALALTLASLPTQPVAQPLSALATPRAPQSPPLGDELELPLEGEPLEAPLAALPGEGELPLQGDSGEPPQDETNLALAESSPAEGQASVAAPLAPAVAPAAPVAAHAAAIAQATNAPAAAQPSAADATTGGTNSLLQSAQTAGQAESATRAATPVAATAEPVAAATPTQAPVGADATPSGLQGSEFTVQRAAPAAAPAPSPAPLALSTPLHDPRWQQDLGRQMLGLVRHGDQRVSLHLNPAELGPLVVELKVSEQQAQMQFLSAHAPVRQAVEQAIPLLREALAEQGISLGEAQVGEQRRDGERQAGSGREQSQEQPAQLADTASPSATVQPLPDGRVNLYI